ncbi:hypothetical protein C8R47DRAFT_1204533 [Mycena vitilis]|nr:hypothetical protein C8R47DRAFT_1204533 [Mycena vitilis]
MSFDAVVQLALSAAPIPGLSPALAVLKFIIQGIHAVKASKKQLEALAEAVAKLWIALNTGFKESVLIVADCEEQLEDLQKLLDEIHQFVDKERKRKFLMAFLINDHQSQKIELFYQRIGAISTAFQVSSAINIQNLLRKNELAKNKDRDALHKRLQALEQNDMQLQEMLQLNQMSQNNILDMMLAIQRKLSSQQMHHIDSQFCTHTLRYLTSMSGQQLQLKDWTISSMEIDYGPQIGAGGFGTVYRGTWNHADVAIKVLRNVVGITPNTQLMRKEIDIWMTLRHPNIIQFLGANTLNDTPFLVMPYMPYNARQFLRERSDFDPINVLCDISLGLQYLHSHRICHGDIKGINILVGDSDRAVLCDFGLAQIKSEMTSSSIQMGYTHTIAAGSRNWMAPELLLGSSPKMPSDIYAFGMTIYELYTDENPLAGIEHSEFREVVSKQQIRPPRPDAEDAPKLNEQVWTLAELCWLHDPKARPLASTLRETVMTVKEEKAVHSSARVTTRDGVRAKAKTTDMPTPKSQPPTKYSEAWTVVPSKISPITQARVGDPEGELKGLEQTLEEGHIDLMLARDHIDLGEYLKAAELQERTLEKEKQVLGESHQDTLHTMCNLAETYHCLEQYVKAAELREKALEQLKQTLGESNERTLQIMTDLVRTYHSLGQYSKAAELGEKASEKLKQTLGENNQLTLHTMSNLATIYQSLGKYAKAAELGEKTLEKLKQTLGESHELTLHTMTNLATTYHNLRQYSKAAELGEKASEKLKQTLGESNELTLRAMSRLAGTYHSLGQYSKAAELGGKALEKQKQVLGESHEDTLWTMSNLATTYQSQGWYAKAAELRERALEQLKQTLGESNERTLQIMTDLVRTYHSLGQYSKAAELGEKASEKLKQTLGENNQVTLHTMSNLAIIYQSLGKYAKAAELGEKALEKLKQTLGESHELTLWTMSDLADTYWGLGQYSNAAVLGERASEKLKQTLGESDEHTLRAMSRLASTYHSLGQYSKAAELGGKALEKQKQVLGESHEDTLWTMSNLATTYQSQGWYAKAAELRERASEKRKQ